MMVHEMAREARVIDELIRYANVDGGIAPSSGLRD